MEAAAKVVEAEDMAEAWEVEEVVFLLILCLIWMLTRLNLQAVMEEAVEAAAAVVMEAEAKVVAVEEDMAEVAAEEVYNN